MLLAAKSMGTELEKQHSSQPKKRGKFTRIRDYLRPKISTSILNVRLLIGWQINAMLPVTEGTS
jgi:hypothetical protein